jgi:hypothetical protein
MPGKARPIRLYARIPGQKGAAHRRGFGGRVDRRTGAGRLIKQVRSELVEHVGGEPTATEWLLIDRCARLSLKVSLIDAKIAAGTDTEYDSKSYLAWSNGLRRCLLSLGRRKSSPKISDLFKEVEGSGSEG